MTSEWPASKERVEALEKTVAGLAFEVEGLKRLIEKIIDNNSEMAKVLKKLAVLTK